MKNEAAVFNIIHNSVGSLSKKKEVHKQLRMQCVLSISPDSSNRKSAKVKLLVAHSCLTL